MCKLRNNRYLRVNYEKRCNDPLSHKYCLDSRGLSNHKVVRGHTIHTSTPIAHFAHEFDVNNVVKAIIILVEVDRLRVHVSWSTNLICETDIFIHVYSSHCIKIYNCIIIIIEGGGEAFKEVSLSTTVYVHGLNLDLNLRSTYKDLGY